MHVRDEYQEKLRENTSLRLISLGIISRSIQVGAGWGSGRLSGRVGRRRAQRACALARWQLGERPSGAGGNGQAAAANDERRAAGCWRRATGGGCGRLQVTTGSGSKQRHGSGDAAGEIGAPIHQPVCHEHKAPIRPMRPARSASPIRPPPPRPLAGLEKPDESST